MELVYTLCFGTDPRSGKHVTTTPPPIIKSHCNDCLKETNHDVIATRLLRFEVSPNDGNQQIEYLEYQFVQCRGCEAVSMRRTWSANYAEHEEVDLFPPAASRAYPKWYHKSHFGWPFGTKGEIGALLKEVYTALHSGSNRIAAMGTRAIIDVALTDKLTDIGGFEKKLGAAVANGWITQAQRLAVEAAVDAGSAAGHRGHRPSSEDLGRLLDVVEHLIEMLYVLEKTGSDLSKTTPPRREKA